jgi:protein SCO1/2
MSEAFRRLGPDAEKMSALFISVDPERDTPEKLKDYLQSFHPRISALTGTQAEIDAVTKAYKAYAKKVPLDGGEYTMDHTAIVYLMDREGRFVAPFNLKRPADEAAKDLRRYL